MSLFKVFDISGSAIRAQTIRLTTTASNMSNANVVSGSARNTYRPRYPIFSPKEAILKDDSFSKTPGVEVVGIYQSAQAPIKRYQPSHPLSNDCKF